ncbi:MAG: hypothetical protein FWC83_02795, partial [Alphaproteobacteria bacterium]|nr:hypothetical protein [Alphaproteobacteria bacterium]
NQWAITAGAAFASGAGDMFEYGDFRLEEFSVKYGITDRLFVSVSVDERSPFGIEGRHSNLELGVNWQVWRPAKSFAMDLIAKYGPTWNVSETTGFNNGMNNFQLGTRLYGDEGRFQWALTGMAQLALANENAELIVGNDSRMWGGLFKAEMEFEFTNCTGIKLEGTFNMYGIGAGGSHLYESSVLVGLVHNVKPNFALMPFVARDMTSRHGGDLDNQAWRFGAQVGVQF